MATHSSRRDLKLAQSASSHRDGLHSSGPRRFSAQVPAYCHAPKRQLYSGHEPGFCSFRLSIGQEQTFGQQPPARIGPRLFSIQIPAVPKTKLHVHGASRASTKTLGAAGTMWIDGLLGLAPARPPLHRDGVFSHCLLADSLVPDSCTTICAGAVYS
ncbi:hypothetical protein BS50DRAFT_331520 [Corynespora cassiicola Philippines]|uniref:Uncharacterized protein n=1 Tax=Corynespora cassiicola Philippines TaxID=1448308 RepID=A0A2T2NUI5_CORCC|nr:hypothetical protein BS50DRAFT_331520 [Corynespora cassiicola Philippines]